MKHLLFVLSILLVLVLPGCPPYQPTPCHIFYHGNGSTSGNPPVDSTVYYTGDTAVILEPGSLENDEYFFLGWRYSDYDYYGYNTMLYQPGERITIWDDINLYAVWDNGLDTPFSFIIKDGEVTITRYNEEYTPVVFIPKTLQSKPVTAIDDNVFSNFSISSVSFPEQLKHIGNGAFASNELTQIVIPDSVETIGALAFQKNSLKRITFGSGLKTLERYTFRDNLLVHITIPETVTSIEAGVFQGNDIEMIKIGAGVTIGSDTSLGTYGASFRTYYNEDPQAGLYLYNGDNLWERL
ncbi:MAG: leucine-rich repeat domain-containing protein [Treponema sp.]|jgi:hypothetical protein|nr:leucine-rich repeat domain-containing protein [Treponema sp.]